MSKDSNNGEICVITLPHERINEIDERLSNVYNIKPPSGIPLITAEFNKNITIELDIYSIKSEYGDYRYCLDIVLYDNNAEMIRVEDCRNWKKYHLMYKNKLYTLLVKYK